MCYVQTVEVSCYACKNISTMILPSRTSLFEIGIFKMSQYERDQIEMGKQTTFLAKDEHIFYIYCYECKKRLVTKKGIKGIYNLHEPMMGISISLLSHWLIIPVDMLSSSWNLWDKKESEQELAMISNLNRENSCMKTHRKKPSTNNVLYNSVISANKTKRTISDKIKPKFQNKSSNVRSYSIREVKARIFEGMNSRTNVISGSCFIRIMSLHDKPVWLQKACPKIHKNRTKKHILYVTPNLSLICKKCLQFTSFLR